MDEFHLAEREGFREGLQPSLSPTPVLQFYAALKTRSSRFSQAEKRLQMD